MTPPKPPRVHQGPPRTSQYERQHKQWSGIVKVRCLPGNRMHIHGDRHVHDMECLADPKLLARMGMRTVAYFHAELIAGRLNIDVASMLPDDQKPRW